MTRLRRRGHSSLLRGSVALVTLALLATGCSLFGANHEGRGADSVLAPPDPSRSLTADGRRLAQAAELVPGAPRYHVRASVVPATGKVRGTLWAELPVGADAKHIRLRYFAGMPSLKTQPSLGPATLGGTQREIRRTHSIATIALPAGHGSRVRLALPFSYTLRKTTSSGGPLAVLGGGMDPAQIGLLSRYDNAVNLGHWVPLWIPPGRSHAPKPGGFGDIGNFPSAVFSLELSVPAGWQVITGGVRTEETTGDTRRTVRAEGYGLRSLAANVVRGYASEQRNVGGTMLRVHGPKSARQELTQVADTAAESMRVLENAFGPYPWRELDVIAAPLGAGVAGMEWSGAVWIEPGIFAGRLPGLGGDSRQLGALLEEMGGQLGRTVRTTRAWTIAHEIGHQWWHVTVGNDSVRAPVVDESLAQYSACLVFRRIRQGSAETLCDRHMSVAYTQMRMLGVPDAPALQRSGEFASSMQYAGVVYGKAPNLYLALEEKYGRKAVVAALDEVAATQAFDLVGPEQLRRGLSGALGDASGVRRLWQHWLGQTHGDTDLGTAGGLGGSGGEQLSGALDELPQNPGN